MTDFTIVPISQEGAREPDSPIEGRDFNGEAGQLQGDGSFRRLAPPVLSREQLRSPLATPGKSPLTSTNPSVSIQDAVDDSNDADEELLPRRRTRRESPPSSAAASAAASAAVKTSALAPSLATPQELVDWCIASAVSVTKLPFEQVPCSIAGQFAAFSAAFQEQVTALYRNQHKLVSEISRVEGDGDALSLASARDFPLVCCADVEAVAASAYDAARSEAVAAEDEEQRLIRLHSEYLSLSSLCSQIDAGFVTSSIMQDGSPIMQQAQTSHHLLLRLSSHVSSLTECAAALEDEATSLLLPHHQRALAAVP